MVQKFDKLEDKKKASNYKRRIINEDGGHLRLKEKKDLEVMKRFVRSVTYHFSSIESPQNILGILS